MEGRKGVIKKQLRDGGKEKGNKENRQQTTNGVKEEGKQGEERGDGRLEERGMIGTLQS